MRRRNKKGERDGRRGEGIRREERIRREKDGKAGGGKRRSEKEDKKEEILRIRKKIWRC